MFTVPATVPGGVYTDLLRAGEISDPYYRFNDVAYRWVAKHDWYYTRTFQCTEDREYFSYTLDKISDYYFLIKYRVITSK